MTIPPLGTVCEHGSLARSCDRCEDAATIARQAALLRRLEWGTPMQRERCIFVCPICESWEGHGHKQGCEMGAALGVQRPPDPAADK